MPDAQRRAGGAHEQPGAAGAHEQPGAAGAHEQPGAAHDERHASAEPCATVAPGHDWPAPAAAGPVHAIVTLPGSKSITNRALVLAALADGPGLIRRPLVARDTLLMVAALRALGAGIDEQHVSVDDAPAPSWRVTPLWQGGPPPRQSSDAAQAPQPSGAPQARHSPEPPPARHPSGTPAERQPPGAPPERRIAGHGAGEEGHRGVDVGNAGTVLRFVPPVATLAAGQVAFDGDPRARDRPVGPLIAALRELGAVIDDGGRGALPFTVHGRGFLPGGAVTLDASGSSQLVSALLLAGARFAKGVEVHHQGPPVPSSPHVAMTIGMLRDAGVRVETTGRDSWRVHPGPPRARCVDVEPDLSNAAPFLAAALVTGGAVTIAGWPARTTQPGDALRDLLTRMGGRCDLAAGGLTVHGSGTIHGITADLLDVTELVPVLTALAALASSPSRFTGIAHMRAHETDRLAALAREINALGGQVTELPDGLAIIPRPLRAAGPAGAAAAAGPAGAAGAGSTSPARADHVFATYDDHRLVMAAAVLGLAVPGLRVANAATVAKTLPGFTQLWTEMLESTH